MGRPAPPQGMEALIAEARELESTGRTSEARTLYEKVMRMPEAEVQTPALLRWIGATHRVEGNGEAAWDCFQASLECARRHRDGRATAHALNWMGIYCQERGRLDEAKKYYRRAERLADRHGDRRLAAMVGQNLGAILNLQGDLDAALAHYTESLAAYRELDDQASVARLLNNLGMLQTDLERWVTAERTLDEAARICEQLGDRRSRAMIEVNRIDLLVRRGRLSEALIVCDRARYLAGRVEHEVALGETYKWYGIIHRRQENYEQAETWFAAAMEVANRFANPVLEAEVQSELALVHRAQERNQAALQALLRAHRIYRDLRARKLLEDVDRQLGALEALFLDIVRQWGDSIEATDQYTAGHCERVADYACMLAAKSGIDAQTLTWFRMGAFLHDVGKTGVPPHILRKPGKLDPQEWAIMKRHTIMGDDMLSRIEFPWDVRPMVRGHHERWDGTGYPDGLAGEAIPLTARILCIADVFDALTTRRPYRDPSSPDEALEIMRRDSGRMFDPVLLARFERLIRSRTRAAA